MVLPFLIVTTLMAVNLDCIPNAVVVSRSTFGRSVDDCECAPGFQENAQYLVCVENTSVTPEMVSVGVGLFILLAILMAVLRLPLIDNRFRDETLTKIRTTSALIIGIVFVVAMGVMHPSYEGALQKAVALKEADRHSDEKEALQKVLEARMRALPQALSNAAAESMSERGTSVLIDEFLDDTISVTRTTSQELADYAATECTPGVSRSREPEDFVKMFDRMEKCLTDLSNTIRRRAIATIKPKGNEEAALFIVQVHARRLPLAINNIKLQTDTDETQRDVRLGRHVLRIYDEHGPRGPYLGEAAFVVGFAVPAGVATASFVVQMPVKEITLTVPYGVADVPYQRLNIAGSPLARAREELRAAQAEAEESRARSKAYQMELQNTRKQRDAMRDEARLMAIENRGLQMANSALESALQARPAPRFNLVNLEKAFGL